MSSNKPMDKLTDALKGLVIGASGTIPGYQHGQIKRMVEKCGAKFASMNISECTHLVTTEENIKKKLKKINRANELEGCQIVNIDWLLKKIKKNVPESLQEDVLKQEGNEGIKLKDKKRERESSLGDDKDSLSKKTKDEDQINLHNMIELVDEKYPAPSRALYVWQDDTGLTWDATLVKVNAKKDIEVLRIQLLVCRESHQFHTWDLQWQFGSSEESKSIGDVGNLDSAKYLFEVKFKAFNGLAWEDRHAISPVKRWVFLEMHHREVPILTSEISPLPSSVENVLKIIFTSGTLQNYVSLLQSRGRNVLLANKMEKKKLLVGVAVLDKLMKLTDSNAKKRLCGIYEHLILKNVTLKWGKNTARKELESLDLLLKLCDACEILERESLSPSLAMSQISQVLGLAKMLPVVENTTEFEMLREFLEKTSSPNHPYQFKNVIGVFRLERPGEAERFTQWEKANSDNIGERRLLWHGSGLSNFAGILTQGLRGDGIVSANGKHFVSGVYFADMSTKSAGYCGQRGEALMLLCEVELGTSSAGISAHHVGGTVHKKWRDAGYIHPDFKGSQVPDVHAGIVTADDPSSGLYHSEYVIQNPAQIRQRYLFHVTIG